MGRLDFNGPGKKLGLGSPPLHDLLISRIFRFLLVLKDEVFLFAKHKSNRETDFYRMQKKPTDL